MCELHIKRGLFNVSRPLRQDHKIRGLIKFEWIAPEPRGRIP